MRKGIVIMIVVLAAMCGTANAQALQLGLKLQYSTTSIDEAVSGITEEVNNFSTDFFKQCDAGLMARISLGPVFLQPEANFSLSSVWDSVDAQDDFFSAAMTVFNEVQHVNLNIPVLVGLKLIDLDKFVAIRVFAGPEFYTSIDVVSDGGFKLDDYSIVGGVGVDLLGFIYVDGRVNKMLKGDSGMFFRVGVGLLF